MKLTEAPPSTQSASTRANSPIAALASGRIEFDDFARPRHVYFPLLRLRMASVRRRSAFSLMKPCASFWS